MHNTGREHSTMLNVNKQVCGWQEDQPSWCVLRVSSTKQNTPKDNFIGGIGGGIYSGRAVPCVYGLQAADVAHTHWSICLASNFATTWS